MKRNITMRTLLCGPKGNMLAGHKYTVDGKQAKTLVEGGFATYDNGEKVRTAGASETADVKPEETMQMKIEENATVATSEVASDTISELDPTVTESKQEEVVPAVKAKPKKRRKRRAKKK